MEISKTLLKNLPKNKYLSLIPKNYQKKTKTIATLVFTLIGISLFGFFAVNPTISTIAQLSKQLDDDKFIDTQLQEKLTNLSILQEKYRALELDLPIILNAVPETPEVPLFVAKIQKLSTTSHVSLEHLGTFQIDLIKQNTAENQPNLPSTFNFSLDIQGTFANTTAFITDLSKLDRLITIDSISFTKKSGPLELISLGIRGKAYYKK